MRKAIAGLLTMFFLYQSLLGGYKILNLNKQQSLNAVIEEVTDPADIIFFRGEIVTRSTYNIYKQTQGTLFEPAKYLNMGYVIDIFQKRIQSGSKHIVFVINSGGGNTEPTERLIKLIRESKAVGVKITCIANGMVASSAMMLMSECSNRFAVFGSGFVWHSVYFSFGGNVSSRLLYGLINQLETSNTKYWAETRKYFFPDYFIENFEQESYISAVEIQQESFGYLKQIVTLNELPEIFLKKVSK